MKRPTNYLTGTAWLGYYASLCLQAARGGCAAGGSGHWRKRIRGVYATMPYINWRPLPLPLCRPTQLDPTWPDLYIKKNLDPIRSNPTLGWTQLPFKQHSLLTPSDDTSRFICSRTTPPSTNCYHWRLRFELLFFDKWRATDADYLLTYLLTFDPTQVQFLYQNTCTRLVPIASRDVNIYALLTAHC